MIAYIICYVLLIVICAGRVLQIEGQAPTVGGLALLVHYTRQPPRQGSRFLKARRGTACLPPASRARLVLVTAG